MRRVIVAMILIMLLLLVMGIILYSQHVSNVSVSNQKPIDTTQKAGDSYSTPPNASDTPSQPAVAPTHGTSNTNPPPPPGTPAGSDTHASSESSSTPNHEYVVPTIATSNSDTTQNLPDSESTLQPATPEYPDIDSLPEGAAFIVITPWVVVPEEE